MSQIVLSRQLFLNKSL